ncbi:MAG TPA: D-alanyl-D-alanine carboxypeptidase/D-alanyl-D-alanine-endopeptidase [Tepidisphaeraceae bacterium]|jgi:D-alanyl-D-alanine carboxypeptidase/D-alanyl-D-alanine-endopeptidase (penicillin-binding protein 4)
MIGNGKRGSYAAVSVFSLILLSTLIGCAHQAPRPDPVLGGRIDTILHRQDDKSPGLKYGARIVDLNTGRELYLHDPDEPLLPASNGKLAVGATALDLFGPSHTFKTYLARDGYDLWIIGTGNPATGDPKLAAAKGESTTTILQQWTDALKQQNISRIKGNIYYYDGAFEATQIHPTWSKDFAGDWYAAPVGGLNFNDNCIDVLVTPVGEGKPVRWSITPPTRTIKIINNCVGAKGKSAPKADISRQPDANVFTLKGAATQPTTLPSKAVTDPGLLFADALRTHLETHGIFVDGKIQRADQPLGSSIIPPADKIIATHETRMSDILARINKDSQNMFADAVYKLSGRETLARKKIDAPGSWSNGAIAVRNFLNKNKIDATHYASVDGSGLSRENRVTARVVSSVLETMYHHRYHQTFFDSMSVAGKDGTLRNRMKEITGHFFGKTGYIGGVRSLSGYVKTNSGRWLAVSIIFNNIEGSVRPVEEMQDDVIRLLVNDKGANANIASAN